MRKRFYEGEREQRGESQEPASPVRVQEGHPLPVPGEERPFERRLRMEVTLKHSTCDVTAAIAWTKSVLLFRL